VHQRLHTSIHLKMTPDEPAGGRVESGSADLHTPVSPHVDPNVDPDGKPKP